MGEQLILTILTKIIIYYLDFDQRRRWTSCIFMVENWTACAIRRFWKSNGRSKIHHLETSQEKWHCLEFWKIPNWQKWQSYQKIQQELSNCPYFQRHFKLGLIFDPFFFKGSYVNLWLEYYHISIWLVFFTKFIRIGPVHHMFSQIWNYSILKPKISNQLGIRETMC